MENVSEIKKRRGRPIKLPSKFCSVASPEGTRSLRGQQNSLYAAKAFGLLSSYQEQSKTKTFEYLLKSEVGGWVSWFEWLKAEAETFGSDRPKVTILSELGRFNLKEEKPQKLMLGVASQVCREEMKTLKAVGYIRQFRNAGESSYRDLSNAIEKTVEKYCDRYGDMSRADILDALEHAASLYKMPPQE